MNMKLYICNALSLSMLDRDVQEGDERDPLYRPRIPRPLTLEEASWYALQASEVIPAVGHADTAAIIANLLNIDISRVFCRQSIKLAGYPAATHEFALIGQYIGPRLPEGATSLPEGATIEWWII